jgi:hypothetical protein
LLAQLGGGLAGACLLTTAHSTNEVLAGRLSGCDCQAVTASLAGKLGGCQGACLAGWQGLAGLLFGSLSG